MNLPLQGQIQAEIDHVSIVSITRVSFSENRPGTVKKGGYGTIGVASGIPDGSGSFVMAVTEGTPEIDLEELKAKAFTISWNRGTARKMATGCKITKIDDANDPGTGNYDVTVTFISPDLITI
jgi:hypothetical protein